MKYREILPGLLLIASAAAISGGIAAAFIDPLSDDASTSGSFFEKVAIAAIVAVLVWLIGAFIYAFTAEEDRRASRRTPYATRVLAAVTVVPIVVASVLGFVLKPTDDLQDQAREARQVFDRYTARMPGVSDSVYVRSRYEDQYVDMCAYEAPKRADLCLVINLDAPVGKEVDGGYRIRGPLLEGPVPFDCFGKIPDEVCADE